MSGYQEYECEKGHRWESLDGHGKCPTCFPANPPLKDGGPAFPFPSGPEPRMNEFHDRWDGMSLRDWFAGQVAVALISKTSGSVIGVSFAVTAYQIADDMLAERNRR